MKNKNTFIYKLVYLIIILIFLFSAFFKTNDVITEIMLTPFIFCTISSIGKNICLILNNKKIANIFSKLFIISFLTFLFGFLIFWGYLCIKGKNYLNILFEIPFFIIGIYIVRKFLFKPKSKKESKKEIRIFNFKIIISYFLVLLVLIIGLSCLFFGIKDTYNLNKVTKNYITTEGYFRDYEIYNISRDGQTTYKLIYTYNIDGNEYTVATDYGVGYIPEKNSIREVKYNPNNYDDSILIGTNNNNFLIYFGGFFTLIGSVFVLTMLYSKGIFDKLKFDIIGLYIGFVLFIIGSGIILFQIGTTSSIIGVIKSMNFGLLIPLLFIIVGIFQIIKSIYNKK